MTTAHKVSALLEGLTLGDVDEMSPADRERFAALCRHWSILAGPRRPDASKDGVLSELRKGQHRE